VGSEQLRGFTGSADARQRNLLARLPPRFNTGAMPGILFPIHYFVFVLPAISLPVGAAISKLSDLVAGRMTVVRFFSILLFAAILSLPILSDKKFFFRVSPIEGCRMIYPESPFPESVRIADYLRENTSRMIELRYWDPNRRFISTHSDVLRLDIFKPTA
jgi:hypothetical protein